MKTNSLTPMGSLHPVLFFVFVYVVALLFSIFICSSLFYSFNARSANGSTEEAAPSLFAKGAETSISFQK